MTNRKVTPDEAEVLYEHLLKEHSIDKRAADMLAKFDLPYFPYECPHDNGLVICMLCGSVVLIGVSFNNIDTEFKCPCVIIVPNDASEITDAQ